MTERRTAADGAVALRDALRAGGGDLADALPAVSTGGVDDVSGGVSGGPGPAQVAALGPRARPHAREYELLIEMVREGAALHYGTPAVLTASDADLGLLLGDQLYALGLARLAELGDLEAVAQLADVISLVAKAEATGSAELVEAVWAAGADAIGWGEDSRHEQAKELARAGDAGAAAALVAVAAARGS